MAVAALALLRKVEPTLKVLLAGLAGARLLYFWKSTLGTGGVRPPETPDAVDFTLTTAGFARMPVCAGATMTAFLP
jgi:hypothetical protein